MLANASFVCISARQAGEANAADISPPDLNIKHTHIIKKKISMEDLGQVNSTHQAIHKKGASC